MTQNTADIVDALNALELGLRELGLWSDARPKAEHLASTMPFCYDTLELEQWLQFIFLGRMREVLEQGDALPESCAISPYVEMLSGAGKAVHPRLARLIKQVDWSISGGSGSGERI
ncbi:MAG: YqcC family protein [Litorivicinaceae bacterium]|tara:strand:+ start:647 stop:994 length:348 start_codon:yes stop_codon:yes gene_type:complete